MKKKDKNPETPVTEEEVPQTAEEPQAAEDTPEEKVFHRRVARGAGDRGQTARRIPRFPAPLPGGFPEFPPPQSDRAGRRLCRRRAGGHRSAAARH